MRVRYGIENIRITIDGRFVLIRSKTVIPDLDEEIDKPSGQFHSMIISELNAEVQESYRWSANEFAQMIATDERPSIDHEAMPNRHNADRGCPCLYCGGFWVCPGGNPFENASSREHPLCGIRIQEALAQKIVDVFKGSAKPESSALATREMHVRV